MKLNEIRWNDILKWVSFLLWLIMVSKNTPTNTGMILEWHSDNMQVCPICFYFVHSWTSLGWRRRKVPSTSLMDFWINNHIILYAACMLCFISSMTRIKERRSLFLRKYHVLTSVSPDIGIMRIWRAEEVIDNLSSTGEKEQLFLGDVD